MVKANLKFFDKLFNIDHGYININNMLSLSKNRFTEVFDQNKLTFILNHLDQVKDKYRDGARNLSILESYLSNYKLGLIKAICEIFPDSVHCYCLHHLLANFRAQSNLSNKEELLIIGIAQSID